MNRVIFAILAVMLTISVHAEPIGNRGRPDNRNNHRNDGRNNGGYGHGNNRHWQPPHNGGYYPTHTRPRPPIVILPPVYFPPVYTPPYNPQPNYPQVQIVYCGSVGYQPNLCYTGMRFVRRIDILRQYSHSPCIPGQTALLQGNSVLVTNGCEADFRIEGNY